MTFNTIMNVTYTNGQSGPCSDKVKDKNIQYGRNAMFNYQTYLNEMGFGTADTFLGQEKPKVALKSSLKYLPEDKPTAENLNKMALLGASFGDLGNKMSIPVEIFTKKMQQAFGQKASAAAFDTNSDGQIDVAENATALLIKDMADKQSPEEILKTGTIAIKGEDIDGNITNVGENNFTTFLNADKVAQSKQVVTQVQQVFKLDEAKNIFAADASNIA